MVMQAALVMGSFIAHADGGVVDRDLVTLLQESHLQS